MACATLQDAAIIRVENFELSGVASDCNMRGVTEKSNACQRGTSIIPTSSPWPESAVHKLTISAISMDSAINTFELPCTKPGCYIYWDFHTTSWFRTNVWV